MLNYVRNIAKNHLAHMPAMAYRKSFSLNELDKRLEAFIGRKRGFFIEAGANNGISQSNTLYFERYFGWSGILIEPIPELYSQCKINRPQCQVVNAALVASSYNDETVEMEFCGLMSTTIGALDSESHRLLHTKKGKQHLDEGKGVYRVDVQARTLSSIIDQFKIEEIDLLSLDVEGYEPMALLGLDLLRHAPRFLLIEVRHTQRKEIDRILAKTYRPVAKLSLMDEYSDIIYALR